MTNNDYIKVHFADATDRSTDRDANSDAPFLLAKPSASKLWRFRHRV